MKDNMFAPVQQCCQLISECHESPYSVLCYEQMLQRFQRVMPLALLHALTLQ